MPDHGRLFDNFSARASHSHGGSYFDEGFGQRTIRDAHGKLYDRFGVPRNADQLHGEHFDDFGWRDLPALHGQQFDSDFRVEEALGGKHGTWFDVFRGGTEVHCLVQGADFEGTVIDVNREFATVRGHDGQTVEVELGQFLSFRTPTQQQASPSMPASDAEAPSAHSEDARGGGERASVPTDMPPVIQEAPQGQYTEPRSGVPEGLMSTFTHLKSLAAELDVAKDVDATETAAQGQSSKKAVGHRSNCPRGGSGPCGAESDGHCTLCGAGVHDHEAVGKSNTGALGINVPERSHKVTDHHTTGAKPKACPHCGGELLDEETESGHPSRKDKQGGEGDFNVTAHKCIGTGLTVLKSLEAA